MNGNTNKEEAIIQIYDKIFKRILTLSNVAVINLINGIFNKDLSKDSKITYNWTENIKNSLEKTISDTIITVNDEHKFHIEVEINSNDGTIALRVFDYRYQEALKYKRVEADKIILDFPESKIIFLEHNNNTPDSVTLQLNFNNGGVFEYDIPAMKFLDYSIDELNERYMIILIPLYLLKLRKEIEKVKSKENALKLKELINDGIIKAIEYNESAGNITHDDVVVLIGLLNKLYAYLYGDIEEFEKEGVSNVLTEKLILETDKIIYEKDREIKDKILEIAKNMLDNGMTVEQVKNITRLPESKIKDLL